MSYAPRGRDRKPRLKGLGLPRGPRKKREAVERRKRAVLADRAGTPTSSAEMMWDRSASGRKSGMVFLRYAGGRLNASPAADVAYWLRSRLGSAKRRRADCTVYDAAGKAVATIDGESRERRPL